MSSSDRHQHTNADRMSPFISPICERVCVCVCQYNRIESIAFGWNEKYFYRCDPIHFDDKIFNNFSLQCDSWHVGMTIHGTHISRVPFMVQYLCISAYPILKFEKKISIKFTWSGCVLVLASNGDSDFNVVGQVSIIIVLIVRSAFKMRWWP